MHFFGVLRQGFSVALEPVLELALVDQAGLKLHKDSPAFASQVLGLKACATTAQLKLNYYHHFKNHILVSVSNTFFKCIALIFICFCSSIL